MPHGRRRQMVRYRTRSSSKDSMETNGTKELNSYFRAGQDISTLAVFLRRSWKLATDPGLGAYAAEYLGEFPQLRTGSSVRLLFLITA